MGRQEEGMDGHQVPAQRRASEEEEDGAQGWPRARQPETDGVRAQRLGLRFGASVAAGLALAAALVCLSSAPGWGGTVLLSSADAGPDAAGTVSAARLEALADSEAHAIFATSERTDPQADGALAAKLLKMQASAWAKGEARRLAASLASATHATDEDAPTPRDDDLSATVLDTLRRTDPAVVEHGDFLNVSPERAFYEAHKDVFKVGHKDRVPPAERRVAQTATRNAPALLPGWTSPHHVTAAQPPREGDAVRLAPAADVHGQHQTPERVVEAFAADTATAAPRSAEPVPAPSVIVTGDVASAVPASVVNIFKQQDAKDSAEAAAEAERGRRRVREREVQAAASARLEARVAEEEKEEKEEEAEEAKNAARKARLAQEEREAKEEEVRVMREQAKLLKKKAEAAKDSLSLAGSLVRAAAAHAAQRPAQGDRKSIDAKSTDAAHTQSTAARTHAAEATQRAAAGSWGTPGQGLEWPSSRAAVTPRVQQAGQVLRVQEQRASQRLASQRLALARKQLERAQQASGGGGGGGDGMSGAHAQPALLASVPPKALAGKLRRTRGAGGLDLLRRSRLQQQPSVSILPPANARGEARSAATPVSAQVLRDQPAAAIVPPGGAAVQPAAANVFPAGAVRIVPPGGPAQPQEQDESTLPTVPEFPKVSMRLYMVNILG